MAKDISGKVETPEPDEVACLNCEAKFVGSFCPFKNILLTAIYMILVGFSVFVLTLPTLLDTFRGL